MKSSYLALILEIAMQGAHYRAIGPGLGRRVKGHQVDQIGKRGYSIVYIYYVDLVTPSSDELAGVATAPPLARCLARQKLDILAGYSGRNVGRCRTRSGGSRLFIREGSRSLHGGGAPSSAREIG